MHWLIVPRKFVLFGCFASLCTVANTQGQSRPALVGNGPKALINMINTQKLLKKGQRDAVVMFECFVDGKGNPSNGITYRGTAGSKALASEVEFALQRCHFVPAIYNQRPLEVIFAGTAVFLVVDGKPRLRVFAHQNAEDLKHESDFVAPQLIPATTDWDKAEPLLETARLHQHSGGVELAITVDSSGAMKDIKVVAENPPGLNFGRASLIEYAHAKFIPGFRDGKPVACTFSNNNHFYAYRYNKYQPLNPTLFPSD